MHSSTTRELGSVRLPWLSGCLLLLAACASTPPTVVVTPQAPAAPADPLHWVPVGATAVASADLDTLRGSALFTSLERALRKQVCLGPDALDWLIQRSSRVVAARFGDLDGAAGFGGLVILVGRYDGEDPVRALRAVASAISNGGAPITEIAHGRHRMFESAGLAAVRLEPRILAVGGRKPMERLLAVASGQDPAWLPHNPLAQSMDAERWLTSHTAALVGELPSHSRRQMERGLAAIGGRRLGAGLQRGAAALTLSSGAMTADARVVYADAAAATEAANQALPVLNRANFLLRLMGTVLPLERTKVKAKAERMELSLELSEVEFRALLERLDWLLDARPAECGVRAHAIGTDGRG